MNEIRVKVVGMTCGHCAADIKRSMEALDGVTSVAVDLPTGTVRVVPAAGAPLADSVLKAVVEDAGFGVVSVTRAG